MNQERRGTGWIVVSGILLVLAGLNLLNNGLWALHANDSIQKTVTGTLLFSDKNLDVWGWIYAIVGFVVVIAGIAVFFRAQWAVLIGIVAATISLALQFLWLFTPYWPAALVTIGLDSVVIVGLSSYGTRTRNAV